MSDSGSQSDSVPPRVPVKPPRVPPPVLRAPAAAQLAPPSMTTTTGYRARALAKVSKAVQSTSEYVSPRLDTVKQSAVGRLELLRDRHDSWEADRDRSLGTPSRSFSSSSRQNSVLRDRDYVDPVLAAKRGTSSSSTSTSSTDQQSRWGGWANYFSSNYRKDRVPSTYGSEMIVSFPGWATLRPSTIAATEPALVLDILAHGYAYRIRSIAQASRSQRIFYSLAKSFAALPKVPPHLLPAGSMAAASQSTETLDVPKEEALLNGNVFETLLEIGGREGSRAEEAELIKATVMADEPEEMTEEDRIQSPAGIGTVPVAAPESAGTSMSSVETSPIIAAPAKVRRQPRINTAHSRAASLSSAPSSPTSFTSPKVPSSGQVKPAANLKDAPSSRSSSPAPHLLQRETPSSSAAEITHSHHEEWPKDFTFEEADLPRLHETLQARLTPFWGFKLSGRRVRLTVYPVLDPGSLWDRPLATKVVSTSSGGAFRTTLEVKSKELRRLLDETGKGVDSLESLRIRVVAELLEAETMGEAISSGMMMPHHELKTITDDESELSIAYEGGVRVISDIDDTIKWTQVLKGTKTIFRNVFVREPEEIKVPGMAAWYQRMQKLGVHFHYVSNSPWELWPVISAFLRAAAFPSGSVNLKEYGGASSAIAKLWEDPGARKRAGVENILKEFPHSKFLLVGDSGEQDLNLYVALACQYPENVLAIYIRDVTTPFHPNAHPDLTHGTSPSVAHSQQIGDKRPTRAATADYPFHAQTQTIKSDAPTHVKRDTTLSRTGPPPIPARPNVPRRDSASSKIQRPTNKAPPSPPLVDQNVDPLSPNNPLRTETLVPTQTETEQALIEAFYQRVVECEKQLPAHIPLRLFRHGAECSNEAVNIVKKVSAWHQ